MLWKFSFSVCRSTVAGDSDQSDGRQVPSVPVSTRPQDVRRVIDPCPDAPAESVAVTVTTVSKAVSGRGVSSHSRPRSPILTYTRPAAK